MKKKKSTLFSLAYEASGFVYMNKGRKNNENEPKAGNQQIQILARGIQAIGVTTESNETWVSEPFEV